MTTKTTERTEVDDATEDDLPSEGKVTEWPSDNDLESDDETAPDDAKAPAPRRMSPRRLACVAAAIMIVALGAAVGWLGVQLQEGQRSVDQRAEYLQAARQGAVNLTTIDWQQVDGDVKRIVDSATGTFYDDFSKRAQPFIDVVKQVQSKTTGTVTMAGLETVNGDQAQALVAVTVETTNAGTPQPTSKAWRMRIDVQKVGNDVKVANVEFVP